MYRILASLCLIQMQIYPKCEVAVHHQVSLPSSRVLSAFYFHVFHVFGFQLLLIYELFKYYLCPLAITVTVAIIVLLSSTHSFLQSTSSAQSLILKQERQAIGMELESNDLANLTHHTRRIDRFLPKDNNLIVRRGTRQEACSDTLSNGVSQKTNDSPTFSIITPSQVIH